MKIPKAFLSVLLAFLAAAGALAAAEMTCDIPTAIETIHTSYQTLEKTFEGVHIRILGFPGGAMHGSLLARGKRNQAGVR